MALLLLLRVVALLLLLLLGHLRMAHPHSVPRDCGDSAAQEGSGAAAECPGIMPAGPLRGLGESVHLCAPEGGKRADAMQLLPASYQKRRRRRELSHRLEKTFQGSSSHSVFFFITSFSVPGQQVPQFSYVGQVDDQEFVFYDASTKRYLPKFPWVRKVENDDPHYWLRNSRCAQGYEQSFQDHLVTLAEHYNQSRGVHTFQLTYGCEMRKDGSKGGYWKYAYDGKDFISFDKETLTWTAADVTAQNTKRKWDADSQGNQDKKVYLEEICIVWLQRYLEDGKEMLRRTEKPEVMVTRKAEHNGMETLICHVRGFYPKDIDIDWTRDGEVWPQDVFHGLVSPNSDGTYYTWRSITVDSKERKRYKCHVEHDGLRKPVDVAWKEPQTPEVMVTWMADKYGMEILICRVRGFYPKDIDIDWTRDGEVWQSDVFHGLVSPNSDGTYYTWRSITVDPKERERYKCHVKHDGFRKPVGTAWKDPAFKLGPIIGYVVGLLLLLLMVGIAVYLITEKGSHNSEERVSSCPSGSMEMVSAV